MLRKMNIEQPGHKKVMLPDGAPYQRPPVRRVLHAAVAGTNRASPPRKEALWK